MSGLRSRLLEERTQALHARRRDLDDEFRTVVASYEVLAAAAREHHTTETAAVQAAVSARADELDAELATSVKAKLYPLVARFGDAPRRTAVAIVEAWRSHAAEVQSLLGEEPSDWVVIAAFLHAAGGDEAVARIGSPHFVLHRRVDPIMVGGYRALADAARDNFGNAFGGVGPAEQERLLKVLESDVAVAIAASSHADAERAEAILDHATRSRVHVAVAALDARRRDVGEAARAADCARQIALSKDVPRSTMPGQGAPMRW